MEAVLAHIVRSMFEAAYAHRVPFEKRRALMQS